MTCLGGQILYRLLESNSPTAEYTQPQMEESVSRKRQGSEWHQGYVLIEQREINVDVDGSDCSDDKTNEHHEPQGL